ncbi:MAG: hypothetical protein E6H54_20480 [Betaproteobacteria bacterium]|nr:MAG: hypothetical protein E6H54_20480 [Betaproteobacteria bacterium]
MRGGVERRGGRAVGMMHPHAADALLGVARLARRAGGEAPKERGERRQVARWPPFAARSDQIEDADFGRIHLRRA